jgi:biopolymer transport protein TolQ
MFLLAAGNPFIGAYLQSDWFGKWIFWGLFLLSGVTWTVLIHKSWIFFKMRRLSSEFSDLFSEKEPLNLQFNRQIKGRLLEVPHPHFEIYKTFKQKVLAMISRNHFFAPGSETYLSEADLGLLESQVHAAISSQVKILEKNLFILSTVVTLAPFLGLLGTVWGILITFSHLHAKGLSVGNAGMLSGLSLALATTVIGLVVAIPAIVGHSYLKNAGKEYRRDMENFSHLLLSSVELQYRKPDHAPKTVPVL